VLLVAASRVPETVARPSSSGRFGLSARPKRLPRAAGDRPAVQFIGQTPQGRLSLVEQVKQAAAERV
jgi:hypothetical protein